MSLKTLQCAPRNGNPHRVMDVATPTDDHTRLESDLQGEFDRLAAANRELLAQMGAPDDAGDQDDPPAADAADELALLQHENAELRARVDELEQLLTSSDAPQEWAERQREYETLLEEKSEVIRGLHLKIQELLEAGVQAASAAPARPSAAQNDDVARLRAELEEQRRQLEQDEESLMKQMRDMEMAMSRDRAELARARTEVQRMNTELAREIDLAARDPHLRDRLFNLQRRQQDVAKGKLTQGPQQHATQVPTQPAPVSEAAKKSSGFIKRMFGGR